MTFIQEILRKKDCLEKLVERLMIMADHFELYIYTNEVNEIEDGMILASTDLFRRGKSIGSPYQTQYVLECARLLLARARSDRAVARHDSLGHCRQALEEGSIPPINQARQAYPVTAPREVRMAYRNKVEADVLAYIDAEIDVTGYTWPEVSRCVIEAALRRAPMSFLERELQEAPQTIAATERAQRGLLDDELGADRYRK